LEGEGPQQICPAGGVGIMDTDLQLEGPEKKAEYKDEVYRL
jgi:hypothetical protein